MSARFEGKVALVTGGTSGIGRAAAIDLAAEGASVAIAGRRATEGEAVVGDIKARGGQAFFVETDVRSSESIRSMVQQVVQRYGRLDCAFNNAGIGGPNRLLTEQTEEDWSEVLGTNLTGMWLSMKYEIPEMIKAGGGAIVNMASIFAFIGARYGVAPYVASKHGIVGLTKAAAIEFAKSNIRVNAVCPGMTITPMTERGRQERAEAMNAEIQRKVPMGRWAEPSEISRVVLWLCSGDASFVTGEAVSVDGGWLAW